jgi:endonuclease-3
VGRLSRRLGLTENTDPEQVEYDLERILPKDHWININFQFIAHGRSTCISRKPDCDNCFLREVCPSKEAVSIKKKTKS